MRAKEVERLGDPPPRSGAPRVVVDDVALARLVHRRKHRRADVSVLRLLLDQVDEGVGHHRLVCDDEDVPLTHVTPTSSSVSLARDGVRMACCAPGTPYSYGDPTT